MADQTKEYVRVRFHHNGFETNMEKDIAKKLEARDKGTLNRVEILGDAKGPNSSAVVGLKKAKDDEDEVGMETASRKPVKV